MLILASASPRRQSMLREEGLTFETIPADVDETPLADEGPAELVLRLARLKAQCVAEANPDAVVLAADTIVALGQRILGKPADMNEARKMIETLSGHTHQVYTGVCIRCVQSEVLRAWVAATDVSFRQLSTAEIDHYLAIASPLDKAGAYAIQEHEELLVKSFDGLYSNVVGLPIEEVMAELESIAF